MRVLLPFVIVCATSTGALADGLYFGEAIGGTDVRDELSSKMSSALRVRAFLGYRHGDWAVEGWLGGAFGTSGGAEVYPEPPTKCGPESCGDAPQSSSYYTSSTLFTYGVDLKYLRPISRNFEVYLRGGLSRGVLDAGDYAGRGFGVGAGAQIKGKVPALGLLFWPLFFTGIGPKITAAAFIEDGVEIYRLHRDGVVGSGSIDARLNHLTIGFAFGSDF